MQFPKLAAAVAACTADIGSVRAKQLECFVRFTLALGHSPNVSPAMKHGLHTQVNQMFQIGLFQHDFETELPATDTKWVEEVLVPWLNKMTQAVEQDRLDYKESTKDATPDDLISMIIAAMKEAKGL